LGLIPANERSKSWNLRGPPTNEIAQDQDRPPLADDIERAGYRAAHIVGR